MKEEVIKCPACLKNSGYTTETDFLENQFESIYENRFATKNTNGYINDGFEVMCDRCGFEFHIYGYVPEPEIKIHNTVDGRAFLEARNIKWPSFIKDDWDLRAFESVLTHLVNYGYEKTKKYYAKFGKDYTNSLKFLKDKIKPVKVKKETEEEEFENFDATKALRNFSEGQKPVEIENYLAFPPVVLPKEPWYKRIWNKIKE